MSGSKQVMSPQLLGKANRFRVLQALVDHGPLSRADLARALGVPRASAGVIINSLVDSGVLQEDSPELSKPVRGKPPRPLWFAKTAGLTVSVSIEPTQVTAGLINARGDILEHAQAPMHPDISGPNLATLVLEQIARVHQAPSELESGIALVVPAQCDPETNIIELCTIVPALTNSSLPTLIAETLQTTVRLEQDVRALASAERWFGSGRGMANFAVLQVDAGVGVGMVMNGHVFPGPSLSSPQVGHTCVDQHGLKCSCGAIGCWETVASMDWLNKQISSREIGLTTGPNFQGLQDLAEQGSAEAEELLREFLVHVSLGLANLIQVLRFPLFILEGELAYINPRLLTHLHTNISSRLTTPSAFEVLPTRFQSQPLLLGGCATALSRHLGVSL